MKPHVGFKEANREISRTGVSTALLQVRVPRTNPQRPVCAGAPHDRPLIVRVPTFFFSASPRRRTRCGDRLEAPQPVRKLGARLNAERLGRRPHEPLLALLAETCDDRRQARDGYQRPWHGVRARQRQRRAPQATQAQRQRARKCGKRDDARLSRRREAAPAREPLQVLRQSARQRAPRRRGLRRFGVSPRTSADHASRARSSDTSASSSSRSSADAASSSARAATYSSAGSRLERGRGAGRARLGRLGEVVRQQATQEVRGKRAAACEGGGDAARGRSARSRVGPQRLEPLALVVQRVAHA